MEKQSNTFGEHTFSWTIHMDETSQNSRGVLMLLPSKVAKFDFVMISCTGSCLFFLRWLIYVYTGIAFDVSLFYIFKNIAYRVNNGFMVAVWVLTTN